MHALAAAPVGLQPQDLLVLPMHKRTIIQYTTSADGVRELHLYYGDKEISFDEPELFAFGEALVGQASFVAAQATGWGEGYTWERVSELLSTLIDEGVLERAQPGTEPAGRDIQRDGARPSPLPPALTTVARSWFECEDITRELAGRAIELGHLELVIPVFRVAHMAMDAEGRQVGEANVFPKALRLDVPTRWRTCIYSGSRYEDERPMNVSALKTMRAHWPQMMSALLHIRDAYLRRFPDAATGWTVGHLECLSTLVLALPTFMLMRAQDRVANGGLHPVLSCLFRVTDGLRMTTHQMLFVPVAEATLSCDTPMTSAEVYAYAERNHAFASTHGVCAGPRVMIEEFLSVLIDGVRPAGVDEVVLDAPVQAALEAVEQAFDYGLLGLQAHVAVFSLWPVMTRTYARMAEIAGQWENDGNAAMDELRRHLQDKAEILRNETLHATEEWRTNRQRVYGAIFAHCEEGLGRAADLPLERRIAAVRQPEHAIAETVLRSLLHDRLSGSGPISALAHRELVNCLMDYFVQAQAILGVACEVQDRINHLLGRAQPQWPFSAADVDVHVVLQGSEARRLPYLIDELENLLGLRASVTKDAIRIQSSIKLPSAQGRGPKEFAGIGSADECAISTVN